MSKVASEVPSFSPHETLLNERAAAKWLGLMPRTLQMWRFTGKNLPYILISARCIRYRVSDLEAFVAARVVSSTSAKTAE